MELSKLIEKYLKKCTARRLTPETIANYRGNLLTFQRWWNDRNLNDLDDDDIDDYIFYLDSLKTINGTTLNNKLRDLRAFIKYAQKKEWCGEVEITIPKIQEPEIIPLEDDQLKDIYDACLLRKTLDRFRDYTIMRMMEETGIRLGECLRLKINDLNFQNNRTELRKTKNKKTRAIYITPVFKKDLKIYLEARERFLAKRNIKTNALWIVTKAPNMGKPVRPRTIQDRINKYGKLAGISIRVSPHTFRHTFARNWIVNGGDIFVLQELLGHSTLDMVRRYVRLFDQDRQNTYFKTMKHREKIKRRHIGKPKI